MLLRCVMMLHDADRIIERKRVSIRFAQDKLCNESFIVAMQLGS